MIYRRLASRHAWIVVLPLVAAMLVVVQRPVAAESTEPDLLSPPWEMSQDRPLHDGFSWDRTDADANANEFVLPEAFSPRVSTSGGANSDRPEYLFSMSALGTTPGFGVGSLGGRLLFFDIVFPVFDFHYLYSVSDLVDFEFRGWTIGILSWVDFGPRLAVRSEGFSFGFRANLMAAAVLLLGSNSAFGGVFGVVPGVLASFGGRSFQFTAGFDVPVPFLFTAAISDEFAAATQAVVMLRPYLAAEFPSGERSNLYVLLSMLVTAESTDFNPMVSLSVGVSF